MDSGSTKAEFVEKSLVNFFNMLKALDFDGKSWNRDADVALLFLELKKHFDHPKL